MNEIINFFLESMICFSLFFAVYHFLLRNESCFQYNRLYLLTTAIISIIFPLINLEFATENSALHAITLEQVVYLPEVTINANKSAASASTANYWVNGLIIIYLGGVAFGLISLIMEIFKIAKLYRQARKDAIEGNIIYTNGKAPTFSFMNYIFLDNISIKNEEERIQVIRHEMAHVKHRHSWDIIFLEIISMFFWFNPVIRWYKKAIAETHEYIADREALHNADKDGYVKTLVHQGLKQMNISLVQPFNASQLLKRINMMDKYNQPTRLFKMLMVIPVIVAVFIVFSCSDQMINIPSAAEKNLPATWEIMEKPDADPALQNKLQEFKNNYPSHDFHIIKHSGLQEASFMLNENWKIIYTNSVSVPVIAIAEYASDQNFIVVNDEVFTIVEDQPQPVGGMQKLYEYIGANLKFPEQAKRMGIEGKVFVQFVVDTDGSIKAVEVVKGIGGGCDKEAAKVIESLPAWKPGIQRGHPVKVRMILPISFQLDQKDKIGAKEKDEDIIDITFE